MRIIHSVEQSEEINCEVVDCTNFADYYVTDESEDGEGYICRKCNEEDDLAASELLR